MSASDGSNSATNPAFVRLDSSCSILMSVGPVLLMLKDITAAERRHPMDGAAGLLFMPTLANYETVLCDYPLVRAGASAPL